MFNQKEVECKKLEVKSMLSIRHALLINNLTSLNFLLEKSLVYRADIVRELSLWSEETLEKFIVGNKIDSILGSYGITEDKHEYIEKNIDSIMKYGLDEKLKATEVSNEAFVCGPVDDFDTFMTCIENYLVMGSLVSAIYKRGFLINESILTPESEEFLMFIKKDYKNQEDFDKSRHKFIDKINKQYNGLDKMLTHLHQNLLISSDKVKNMAIFNKIY